MRSWLCPSISLALLLPSATQGSTRMRRGNRNWAKKMAAIEKVSNLEGEFGRLLQSDGVDQPQAQAHHIENKRSLPSAQQAGTTEMESSDFDSLVWRTYQTGKAASTQTELVQRKLNLLRHRAMKEAHSGSSRSQHTYDTHSNDHIRYRRSRSSSTDSSSSDSASSDRHSSYDYSDSFYSHSYSYSYSYTEGSGSYSGSHDGSPDWIEEGDNGNGEPTYIGCEGYESSSTRHGDVDEVKVAFTYSLETSTRHVKPILRSVEYSMTNLIAEKMIKECSDSGRRLHRAVTKDGQNKRKLAAEGVVAVDSYPADYIIESCKPSLSSYNECEEVYGEMTVYVTPDTSESWTRSKILDHLEYASKTGYFTENVEADGVERVTFLHAVHVRPNDESSDYDQLMDTEMQQQSSPVSVSGLSMGLYIGLAALLVLLALLVARRRKRGSSDRQIANPDDEKNIDTSTQSSNAISIDSTHHDHLSDIPEDESYCTPLYGDFDAPSPRHDVSKCTSPNCQQCMDTEQNVAFIPAPPARPSKDDKRIYV